MKRVEIKRLFLSRAALQDQRKRPRLQLRDQSLECSKNLSDTKQNIANIANEIRKRYSNPGKSQFAINIGKQEKKWQGCVINTL